MNYYSHKIPQAYTFVVWQKNNFIYDDNNDDFYYNFKSSNAIKI